MPEVAATGAAHVPPGFATQFPVAAHIAGLARQAGQVTINRALFWGPVGRDMARCDGLGWMPRRSVDHDKCLRSQPTIGASMIPDLPSLVDPQGGSGQNRRRWRLDLTTRNSLAK